MLFQTKPLKNAKKTLARRHRDGGFNALLSYLLLLEDGTVWHKDGSLSRYFQYQPADLTASTAEAVDYHAATWRDALAFLGDGWCVETNVISEVYQPHTAAQPFPELVSALIDDERRLQYQSGHYFTSTNYLTLTWKPRALLPRKLTPFVRTSDELSDQNLTSVLQPFNRSVQAFLGFLQRAVPLQPLSGDDLTTFLYHCISGRTHPLPRPSTGAFLDSYLSPHAFIGGLQPRIGDHYIQMLCIDQLPPVSYPMIFDLLSCFPLNYRWSCRFMPCDMSTTQAYLKKITRNWSSKAIGVTGLLREAMGLPAKINPAAQRTVHELENAQVANESGDFQYGFFNLNVVLMHPELATLKKITAPLVKRLQQLNGRVRLESINAVEAYLGSLPGHGGYNVRQCFVDSHFVSHALPISATYSGQPHCPCPYYGPPSPALFTATTAGDRPFHFNLHVNDVGHTLILGPTGKGKSTLVGLLMASHRKYPGSRILVLDKDHSHRLLIQALGGQYVDMQQGDYALSPLARMAPDQPQENQTAFHWLIACCEAQGLQLSPQQHRELHEALLRLSQEEPRYKNLSYLTVQDPAIRSALSVFQQGAFQSLLNGTQSTQPDVMGFEMGDLISATDEQSSLNVCVVKALLNELTSLFHDRRPTLLILEEAWLYLRHPLFKRQLAAWFKTLRKMNVAVIFISQDLNDIVDSTIASVIQSACPTKIYLPNESATQLHKAYQALGLNDIEIQQIQQAIPKQDYYYTSSLGRRWFQLDLGVLSKTFLCVSLKKDLHTFNALKQKYANDDPQWVCEWLAHWGLTEWAAFVKKNYIQSETKTCGV